jgi:hypothetical protein
MDEYNGKGRHPFGEVDIKVSVHECKYEVSKINKLYGFRINKKRQELSSCLSRKDISKMMITLNF